MYSNRTRSTRALSSFAAMAVAVVFGATACNTRSEVSSVEFSCAAPESLSTLAHWADAAVIGTVASVSTYRLGPDATYPYGDEYRTATLDVEQALWSNEELPAEPGKSVTVTMLGNGRHEGDPYCYGNARMNDMAGPVAKGRRVLLLLDSRDLNRGMKGQEDGVLGNFIAGSLKGNWTIQGNRAVNVIPERAAPLDALVTRLIEAHNAPVDFNSRRGAIDPLEAIEPPLEAPPVESPSEPPPFNFPGGPSGS